MVKKSYNKIDVVHDIDSVPSNVQSASREALLYVNGIHPAPDIHEQSMIHKGFGTLRISSRTTSTILSAL